MSIKIRELTIKAKVVKQNDYEVEPSHTSSTKRRENNNLFGPESYEETLKRRRER